MAATLAAQYAAATDASAGGFVQKVTMAAVATATSVIKNDVAPGPGAEIRALKRLALANAILTAPAGTYVQAWCFALAAAGLDAASTDNAIGTAITNNWNAMAGVAPGQ